MMVEAGSNKITEEQMLNAILTAHEEIKNICEFISEIQKEVGKEKAEYVVAKIDEELEREVFAFAEEDMKFAIKNTGEQALEIAEDLIRSDAVDIIVIDSVAALTPQAEIEGDMGDSHMGLQARLMNQALRKLTARRQIGRASCRERV